MGEKETKKYKYREFHNILLKLFILKKIDQDKKAYPYDIIKKIKKSPLLSNLTEEGSIKNDVYNIISVLEKAGYIESEAIKSDGKIKKYYHITPDGKKALNVIKKDFHKLVKTVTSLIK
ncbi:PadR subfamily 2 transcriptional regulator [Candidatus Mancarchaeum acidiphilum]|uniref:PadR subfamily 2 transcriptional regulator n=1 Tax=Candidatus Mancarchaeum acidiphilum TaxID=1920749 RepID=A0A218NM29_9ARCH|nr:PadR family transcriptional regulator [Candidatus Mancarchaeum acidiphilum]ASI13530.1 PadR subfamily 2 transcriptional regulator [Candidatus Mancarchaeum acidiphilum]